MPRTHRRCPGGVVFHVLNRAVARMRLFRGDRDYLAFERALAEALARMPSMELFAYCLMPNHWHLVLRPREDGQLSTFMQWLTLAHAQRWRRAHHTVGFGPLYQGRFKSFPIQCDRHLLTVLRYVERNPRRAELVSRAEQWRWSSLHRRTLLPAGASDIHRESMGASDGNEIAPPQLSPWPLDIPPDWIDWVNEPQTRADEEAILASIRRSIPFGAADWQRRAAASIRKSPKPRRRGRPALRSAR